MNKLRLMGLIITTVILLSSCGGSSETSNEDVTAEESNQEVENIEVQGEGDNSTASDEATEESDGSDEIDFQTEAEANAEEYPAKPGAMLYDKTEEKFKGMNYHFKGMLVKVGKVEGLFGGMEDAFLVKNDQGYVMPIFPPYEMFVSEGDEIEAWGPLSGDGYASSDLGVDNVVGVAGAMNATRIDINGEMQ